MMPSSVTDTSQSEKLELGSVMPNACSVNMTTSCAVVSWKQQIWTLYYSVVQRADLHKNNPGSVKNNSGATLEVCADTRAFSVISKFGLNLPATRICNLQVQGITKTHFYLLFAGAGHITVSVIC